jgi:hypothetical protein
VTTTAAVCPKWNQFHGWNITNTEALKGHDSAVPTHTDAGDRFGSNAAKTSWTSQGPARRAGSGGANIGTQSNGWCLSPLTPTGALGGDCAVRGQVATSGPPQYQVAFSAFKTDSLGV